VHDIHMNQRHGGRGAKARFPTEGYRALAESQLYALVIPVDYGGVGADAVARGTSTSALSSWTGRRSVHRWPP